MVFFIMLQPTEVPRQLKDGMARRYKKFAFLKQQLLHADFMFSAIQWMYMDLSNVALDEISQKFDRHTCRFAQEGNCPTENR
jgi:hypothetical protein